MQIRQLPELRKLGLVDDQAISPNNSERILTGFETDVLTKRLLIADRPGQASEKYLDGVDVGYRAFDPRLAMCVVFGTLNTLAAVFEAVQARLHIIRPFVQ